MPNTARKDDATVNPLSVSQGGKRKKNNAAAAAATEDLKYRYNLQIERALMLSFQHECKMRGTDAASEIRDFVLAKMKEFRK